MSQPSNAPPPAGRRVLVTAGAGGIGKAIADALAAAGAKIWICDVAEPALAVCRAERPDWRSSLCDVADEAQVDRLFAEVTAAWDGLDVLVNNAGIAGPTGPIEAMDPADWRRTIDVDLNGMFYCTRRAVPHLKASQGVIVNLSSVAGRLGYAYRTPYAAAKWAVVGLTKSLANELGPFGVRVNCIPPGVVEGSRIAAVIRARAETVGVPYAQMEERYRKQAALERMVTAEDVAATALFLCGPGGRNVTGQALSVCGHVEKL